MSRNRGAVLLLRSAEFATTPALPRFASVLEEVVGAENTHALCWRTNPKFVTPQDPEIRARVVHFEWAGTSKSLAGLLGLLVWWARIARQLVSNRYALVQASDVFALLPCVLLRPLCGFRLVADIRDHMATIAGTHWGLKARVLGVLESALVTRSDAVIVVDETRKELLPPAVANSPNVYVVRNVPLADAGPVPAVARDGVRVNFSGFLSRIRGADMLVDATEACDFATLDVVGQTNEADIDARMSRSRRIVRHGRVSHREAMERMGDADLIALLYDPAIAANRYAAPNKYYEAMMLGRPVVVSEGTPMAEWVRKADCGYVVKYGDAEALVNVLECVAGRRSEWKAKCANARSEYDQRFRWADEARRLAQAYRNVLAGTSSSPSQSPNGA